MDQSLFTMKNIQTIAEMFKIKNGMSSAIISDIFLLERKSSQPYATK